LQKTAFVLARQARLMRTAALWCAPVFVGTALIGMWLFHERSQAEGYMLWAIVGMGWGIILWGGAATGRKIDRRRVRIEQLLSDLT
jgi:surface polysaccharide O-acyltransferase-like enzyme